MKKYIHFYFLLFVLTSFSQVKFDRTKADFYTISKNEFISYHKHQNSYSSFAEHFQYYRRKVIAKKTTTVIPTLPKEVEKVSDIRKFDFEELLHQKFISYKDAFKYELFQLNTELFVLKTFIEDLDDKDQKIWRQYGIKLIPFTYVDLKKGKKIIKFLGYTAGHIIPKKEALQTTVWIYHNRQELIPIQFSEIQTINRNFTSKELSELTSGNYYRHRYYEIVSNNKKRRLYNYRGEDVLKKSYDSIVLNNFIIGYKRNKIDVYNHTFQKLELPKLQAAHLDRSNLYNLQVIQNNEFKQIPLSGDTSEKYVLSNPTPPYMPSGESNAEYTIEERESEFALMCDFMFDTLKISKEHTKDMFFLGNKKKKIKTNQAHYIITLQIDNRYSLLNSYKPTKKLLEAVDGIELIGNSIRFKENNLYGYYGIHKKARFKRLEVFQGFFARFELPDGQKGWLDRNGKEYLDI